MQSTRLPGDAVGRVFKRSVQAGHHRLDAAERVLDHLLRSKAQWGAAAGSLLTGVVAGTIENFLGT